MTNENNELERIFLSCDRILEKLKLQNIKTRRGKEITYNNLKKAISIMEKKHYKCRWKYKIKDKGCYILTEGYYWLIYVYFQSEKNLIDADIDFFELRIKQYKELLNVNHTNIFIKDMYIFELEEYFNRKIETIKKAISKMQKVTSQNYIYMEDKQYKISRLGIEWLCKNCFKRKYLELLENCKMQLTEKYIEVGYLYDNFFELTR